MKVLPTRHRQKVGEAQVAKLIEEMGHSWREAGRESIGVDGYVEIVRGQLLSGQIVGVQIKAGRGHLTTRSKQDAHSRHLRMSRRRIKISNDHLNYFKECKFPVIIVLFDPNSGNAFWGEVDSDSATAFPVPHVLDRFASRQIARIADRWHSNYPVFEDARTPRIPVRAVKQEARAYYESLRRRPVGSVAYGQVRFTLRGWRHITRQNSERSKMLRSLELLGTAVEIMKTQENFHVCRKTEAGHILCKQTAKIKHPNRADAVVSVITEKIQDGAYQFLSVYEHGKRRKRARSKYLKKKKNRAKVGGR